MREYGTWQDPNGRTVPMQLVAPPRRRLAWARGWGKLLVAPADAAMVFALDVQHGWVWLPWVVGVLAALSAVQLAALGYALYAWTTPDQRRRVYQASSNAAWVVSDLLILAPVFWCWLTEPAGRGPDVVLRAMIAILVAGTALDVRAARASRRWRPWNTGFRRARRRS